jgi:glycosyltransferase involved in cell wall biosynthesis
MVESINERAERCGLSASYFCRADASVFRWLSRTADQLVVCRSGEEDYLLELISLFRDRLKPIIFDTDDLVVDPSYARQIAYAVGQDLGLPETLNYWHAYTSRMRAVALRCDAICTTNKYLSRLASSSLGVRGLVIQNSMNMGQLKFSKMLYEQKRRQPSARSQRFTIGYFSGSPSHLRDFAMMSEALAALMSQRDDAELLICGFIELSDSLLPFRDRVIVEPFRDHLSLQGLIAKCEISIAPLEYSTFTNCKSELKYFESAVVGTLCIASPTFVFRSVIEHGVNGWISRSHQWGDVLNMALDLQEQERAQMMQNACGSALSRFGPEALWQALVKSFALKSQLTIP